jgi:hypothetical protein
MMDSEEFEALAQECDELASEAHEPEIRHKWSEFASRWRELAAVADPSVPNSIKAALGGFDGSR